MQVTAKDRSTDTIPGGCCKFPVGDSTDQVLQTSIVLSGKTENSSQWRIHRIPWSPRDDTISLHATIYKQPLGAISYISPVGDRSEDFNASKTVRALSVGFLVLHSLFQIIRALEYAAFYNPPPTQRGEVSLISEESQLRDAKGV